MTTLKEMIEEKGITATFKRIDSNPLMDVDMFHYSVTLKKGEKEMVTTFSTGAGWVQPKQRIVPGMYVNRGAILKAQKDALNPYFDFKTGKYSVHGRMRAIDFEALQLAFEPKPPTAEDVLDCLLSDDVSDYDSFEDWAPEFGYDTDSRKAKKIFEACQTNTSKLRKLLGADFNEFTEVER